MASQAACWKIQILTLDLAAKDKVQCALDKGRLLGPTDAPQSSIALIAVAGGTEEVENFVVLEIVLVMFLMDLESK